MAPPPCIDFSDDLDDPTTPPNSATKSNTARTLLLAPPSLASNPTALTNFLKDNYPDRSHADVQMLDRLSMGLVALPTTAFDLILLLSDADGSRTESTRLINRTLLDKCVQALKPGGWLRSLDNAFASEEMSTERTDAVLAGLVAGSSGMQKPEKIFAAVPLKLRKAAKQHAEPSPQASAPIDTNGSQPDLSSSTPAGVGFDNGEEIDLDALVEGSDNEMIDEDDLLTEEDKKRPVNIPAECQPVSRKKRRRACKDCTCGLAQRLEAEDKMKRSKADAALANLQNDGGKTSNANGGPNATGLSTVDQNRKAMAMLGEDDLAEVDFTIPGKVGSCGNCALGDAFRCDGCPYIGLPAFKPGEEVRLVNNDMQL